jgi:hypothetical protein
MNAASRALTEPRLVECPSCHGAGDIEYGHPNAPYPNWAERCRDCDATGLVEIDDEPITVDDLDEMSGETQP